MTQKDPTKQRAGSIGGTKTFNTYGRDHMIAIGKLGAEATWKKYTLIPFELAQYAMVDRETGKIIAYW